MKATIPSECFHAFMAAYKEVKTQEHTSSCNTRDYFQGKRFGLIEGLATLSGLNWYDAMILIEEAEA
jgi:hypothetical protein